MFEQVLFAIVTVGVFSWAGFRFSKIRRNISLGLPDVVDGPPWRRWQNVFLIAFGQRKMFKNWIPALLHLFIYAAFLLTQIELIEILADGFIGSHRIFSAGLGGFYTFLLNFIEVLSLLAFIATIAFLVRRNLLKVPRFWKPEMKGWPFQDANLILFGEILLLIGIFSMNGADRLLQNLNPAHYPPTGSLLVSDQLAPIIFGGLNESSLVFVERFGWWLHILTVYGFLIYLPFSKHLHIFLAFPNTYFGRLSPNGKMENMPAIMQEVKSMMGIGEPTQAGANEAELPVFGANDVFSLSQINLLNAYTCTECGRCTAACPANLTGKLLSPRKVMMDVRDRMEEVGRKLDSASPEWIDPAKKAAEPTLSIDNFSDGKSLFDYITREEIHACTTCNACVEACPVMINPLDIILKLRRYEILTESAGPGDWLPLFNSIENSGSAWQIADDRDKWAKELSNV